MAPLTCLWLPSRFTALSDEWMQLPAFETPACKGKTLSLSLSRSQQVAGLTPLLVSSRLLRVVAERRLRQLGAILPLLEETSRRRSAARECVRPLEESRRRMGAETRALTH